ncbi:hypothetical protein [Rhodococcus opacus]|uniref:hypothetical protein n=1 Tax=Rhodococcus opacus TaxID=37919 RepID=UPI00223551B8|nr:hypothetical protein [Rhodococcus opacus]MDJ0416315.1 hypothetical protein [Rhodococcus opacus]UZG58559.1 hypothetical protein ONE62_15160 [Rhodococcus opacus]
MNDDGSASGESVLIDTVGALWSLRGVCEARDWLTPRFGERVGWLAGAHVAAKRYLVATESGYAATLSDQSVATLEKQGGAAVDAEFTKHSYWPDAVRLRRYDDAAKIPGAQAPSVHDVIAVARRVRLAVLPTP